MKKRKHPGQHVRQHYLEDHLAVASMALLVVITLLNVVTRYITDDSFAWTEEVSVFLMVLLALSGASAVALRDRHIRIEFLFNRRNADGQEAPRRPLKLLSSLVSGVVFLTLAFLLARWVLDQYRFAETSMGLGVPLWWYGVAMPILCLAIAVRSLQAFVRTLRYLPDVQKNAPSTDSDSA